jgi:hypothetical protein
VDAHPHAAAIEGEPIAPLLRRVGAVLIVVGALDIAWLIYSISQGRTYSSGLNIFAVIAGILLRRQNLRAVRMVRWCSAFFLASCVGIVVAIPIIFPLDLVRTYLRVTPATELFGWVVLAAAALGLFGWVYRSLGNPAIERALCSAGLEGRRFWNRPRAALWLGACLAGLFAVLIPLSNRSGAAREAISRARQGRGPEYRYFVSFLSTSVGPEGRRLHATVLAYTDSAIETVDVSWRE